ncbi:MAG TPA: hypothetical protein VF624_10320 [Tepidisphaeraceae bacterium]|jgi:hypothetical protein
MYGFFENHGKKFLAIAAVLLIVVMLLPPSMGNYGRGGSSRLGTLDGEALDLSQVDPTFRSLELLEAVTVRTARGDAPLVFALFGPEVHASFGQDPRLYYLLVDEARKNGVSAGEADVGDVLRNEGTRVRLRQGETRDFAAIEQSSPAYARTIEDAVRDALSVFENERHAQRSIKVSTPAVRQEIARQTQEIRVRVRGFDGAATQPAAPLSDAQLTEHFNRYAAIKPGTADNVSNPFGFGYRVPDRIRIDYVEVPLDEVRRAVEASKSPEEWDEEAQLLYLRDPSKFAATQPAATQSTQQTAAPTTRPFTEARADVLNALRGPLVEQRRRAVANRIQQQFAVDYAAASDNGAATTQKVESASPSFGVAYSSFEYLQKVRENVQRQFGVGVTVVREQGMQTESQLTAHPVLGKARTEAAGNDQPRSAGEYLFGSLRPLFAGDVKTATGLIGLYEPFKPMTTETATVIVRAVAAEASHPPASLADARTDVEKDVRRKLAFEKASDEAAALAKSTAGGLDGAEVETSGWFKVGDFTLPGVEKSAGPDAYVLIGPAFDMLQGLKSKEELPVRKVVPIYSANRACVVELFDVRSTATADELALIRQSMAMQLQQSEAQLAGLQQSWFDRDAVFRRTKFVPAEASNADQPAAPAAPPRTVLMP